MPRHLVQSGAGALACLAAVVIAATAVTAAPTADTQVFCTDLGIDFEFTGSSHARAAAAPESGLATSCLRHVMMNAVGNYLAAQMDTFAMSAVDCTQESGASSVSGTAPDASTEFFAVFSVCSRSNVQLQTADARAWDASVRAEIDETFGAKSTRDGIHAENGAVWIPRRVTLSPSYTLPDGKGMPRFEFRSAKITVNDATGIVSVEVAVRNTGKVPLHLFRVTLIESAGHDRGEQPTPSAALLALLPTPTAVEPGKAANVVFRSPSPSSVTIAASKSYVVYISHSGFRSHRFEGVLQSDNTFASTTSAVATTASIESGGEFLGVLSPSAGMDPLLSSFPLGSWRVFSIAIVAIVGLAATLYTRRRWSSVSLRRVSECLRQSMKPSPLSSKKKAATHPGKVQEMATSGAWKSKTSDVDALHDSVSDREMDELESEGLIVSSSAPVSAPARQSKPRQSASRDTKMPAIQMQWKPPVAMPDSFRKPLDLDGSARLDPRRFENLWDEYMERFQSNDVLAGAVDADALIAKMQALGVTCMASGTVNGVDKFVFYAQPRARNWFFFFVLDITIATRSVGMILRTSSDARDAVVDDFVCLAKAAIHQAVSPQM